MVHRLDLRMVSVFVEWSGRLPDDRLVPEIKADGCFDLHGLSWQESIVCEEDGRKICHYRAPDAESVRLAFRQGGIHVEAVWTGAVHEGSAASTPNIVVEQRFRPPLPANAARAVAIVRAECLAPRGFGLVRAIFPANHERIICLCTSQAGYVPVPYGEAVSIRPCSRVAADAEFHHPPEQPAKRGVGT